METPLMSASSNTAGQKRPPPSLLPAFEPSSSPPRFKRQKSRQTQSLQETENRYPTPVPSSSLGVNGGLPSSPPAIPSAIPRRPLLQRTQSTVSERAPLAAVPSIILPENGEPVLMGRSSNSSHYRLSANRLISRVHVKAVYLTGDVNEGEKPKVEVTCLGWNGVKVHCQGHAWDLGKGDVFTSETEHAEIMLDVQDSRVLLVWPHSSRAGNIFDRTASPLARVTRSPSVELPLENDENADPQYRRAGGVDKLSPFSPVPKSRGTGNAFILPSESQIQTDTFLEIYEDEPVPELPSQESLIETQKDDWSEDLRRATRSIDFNFDAPDDGADAVKTSYCPEAGLPPMKAFGGSSIPSSTPPPPSSPPMRARRQRSSDSFRSVGNSSVISPGKVETVQNHLTNQLAFSRVATTPLTELFENLPEELAATATRERLVDVLANIDCIGEVKRHGKDAAGKPLESQYYYIAERDEDEARRMAVGGRAGLRNCRKTHKQYFWRKPKKPAYG